MKHAIRIRLFASYQALLTGRFVMGHAGLPPCWRLVAPAAKARRMPA